MREYSSKLKRQVALMAVFDHDEAIICLDVICKNVPGINIRTLERDIKELNEAGFMDVKYDRAEKTWSGLVRIPDKAPELSPKRRKDFDDLVHFEKILFTMRCFTYRDAEMALDELHEYKDMHDFWEEDDMFGPEPVYMKKYLNEELSVDKAYFRLFPDAEMDDFEKDVNFLRDIGYPIEYDKELQVYYADFPELLRA